MRTLNNAISARFSESQARIREIANEMIPETALPLMRKELQLSQKKSDNSDGDQPTGYYAAGTAW